MKNIVISISDIQKLKGKLKILNEEYIKLYEKLEDLKKEKEYLESMYMCKLGALIFLRFENEIKYRKLKKKLTLMIAAMNKNEKIDHMKIEKILEKDLVEYYKDLDELRNNLNNSRRFLELPTLTIDEIKKVKEIFRKLAKILHPDINKDLNTEMMELWLRVKEAYENNDLALLIIFEGIVNKSEIKEDVKISYVEENITVLKLKINELKILIDEEENDFPLNIRDDIDDETYIKGKKQELTYEIHEYDRIIEELENKINAILKGEGLWTSQ